MKGDICLKDGFALVLSLARSQPTPHNPKLLLLSLLRVFLFAGVISPRILQTPRLQSLLLDPGLE